MKQEGETCSLPNGDSGNLRDLYAEFRAQQAEFKTYKEMMNERDKRYASERLGDQRAIEIASRSSEKAIDKAEQAQSAYNARSNEFRQALDDKDKLQMSRTEIEARFIAQEEKIEA